MTDQVSQEAAEKLYQRLDEDAEASGYHLNPDREFTMELVRGLSVNTDRYGYQSCPCRLATGDKHQDLDIICPCDYRDPDLLDYGACYCALYVSEEVVAGEREIEPVPERRPTEPSERAQNQPEQRAKGDGGPTGATMPVWRCRVCGYLCARERPPGVCPICKAKQERFERFW